MKKRQSVLKKNGEKPKIKLRVSFGENVSQREFLSSEKSYSDIQSKQLDSHKDLSKQWEEIDALDKQEKEIENNYLKVKELLNKEIFEKEKEKNEASKYYEKNTARMIIHTMLYKIFPKIFQFISIQDYKRMQSYMGLELEAMKNIKEDIDTNYNLMIKPVIKTKGMKIDTLTRTIDKSFGDNQTPEKKLETYQTEKDGLEEIDPLFDLKQQFYKKRIRKLKNPRKTGFSKDLKDGYLKMSEQLGEFLEKYNKICDELKNTKQENEKNLPKIYKKLDVATDSLYEQSDKLKKLEESNGLSLDTFKANKIQKTMEKIKYSGDPDFDMEKTLENLDEVRKTVNTEYKQDAAACKELGGQYNNAATKIQSAFRGMNARKSVPKTNLKNQVKSKVKNSSTQAPPDPQVKQSQRKNIKPN